MLDRTDKYSIRLQHSIPRVSVIVPNFNHARFISAAIQSVLKQTYRLFEIIVVDDGSTDDSREVVGRYGSQVRYIWQENQGLGAARNTGIMAAEGEYIGLLDADDLWQPEFLEKMIRLAEREPQASVYYCNARYMDENGVDFPIEVSGSVVPPESTNLALLRANFIIPSSVVMRRSVVMAAGLFEHTNRAIHGCEDWDLWLRLAPEQRFVGIPESLVRYRLHSQSLSANTAKMQRSVRAVIKKHFGPDDRDYLTWSLEKCRAYGGVYRYSLLTSVQRQNDWNASACCLRRALKADPTLAEDIDLFFQLALGSQPIQYRGSSKSLKLGENAERIDRMLADVFSGPPSSGLQQLRRRAYGTAYLALGIVGYNARQFSLARKYLVQSVRNCPDFWRDERVVGNLIKSLAGPTVLESMRRCRRKLASPSNRDDCQTKPMC